MSHLKPTHFSSNYLSSTSPAKIKPADHHKNASPSPSHSTQRREFVTNMPSIDTYRQINRIALTDDSIQKIHEKLQVETSAEREFERRQKTQDLFINYNMNPLTKIGLVDPPAMRGVTKRSILQEINNLKLKNNNVQLSKHLQTPKTTSKDLCTQFAKQRQRAKIQVSRNDKENIRAYAEAPEQVYVKTEFELLDEIVSRQDVLFFDSKFKKQERNIFKLVTGRDIDKFQSNKEALEQYYFCFDSIFTLTQKASVVNRALEEISVFSRELARGHISKKMPERILINEGDLNLVLEDLKFDELMLVATNRLRSEILLRYFHEEEEDTGKKKVGVDLEDESSLSEKAEKAEAPIDYPENTQNQLTNFNENNHDRAEIEYYNKSIFTAIEQRQSELSKKYQNKLKRLIEMERLSISNTIEDKTILAQFKQQKTDALFKALETNVDARLNLSKETQRKIRMNKMSKNRTEKVKIDVLIQSFRMKKRLQANDKRSASKRKGSLSPTLRSQSKTK